MANGAARRRVRMIIGAETPDRGRIRLGEPSSRLCRPVAATAQAATRCGRDFRARTRSISPSQIAAGLLRPVQLPRPAKQKRSGNYRAASATGAFAMMLKEAPTCSSSRADHDLDVDTLRVWKSAARLSGAPSHHPDRWFLDRIATSSPSGEAKIVGSRQLRDYEADRRARPRRRTLQPTASVKRCRA